MIEHTARYDMTGTEGSWQAVTWRVVSKCGQVENCGCVRTNERNWTLLCVSAGLIKKKVVVIESAPPLVPLIFLFSVSFRTVLMNPRIAVPEQETAKCSSRSSSVFTFQSGSYDTKGLDHLPTFSKDRRNTCTVYMQVSAYILQPQKTTVPWASFSHTLHRVNDLDDSVQLHDLFSRGSNFRPKYFERVYINHRYVRAHFS